MEKDYIIKFINGPSKGAILDAVYSCQELEFVSSEDTVYYIAIEAVKELPNNQLEIAGTIRGGRRVNIVYKYFARNGSAF